MPQSREGATLAEIAPRRDPISDEDRSDPPLDLVHLARQCQGDDCLQDELLRLFRQQSRVIADRLSSASLESSQSKAELAHRLRGSALAVGAKRVARAAAAVEQSALVAYEEQSPCAEQAAAMARAVVLLQSLVGEAVAEIERICG